jgi:hypothetical protein
MPRGARTPVTLSSGASGVSMMWVGKGGTLKGGTYGVRDTLRRDAVSQHIRCIWTMTPHCSTTARCWTGLASRLAVHHRQEQQHRRGRPLLADAAQRRPGRRPAVLVRQQRGGRAQQQLQVRHGEAADESTWAREEGREGWSGVIGSAPRPRQQRPLTAEGWRPRGVA